MMMSSHTQYCATVALAQNFNLLFLTSSPSRPRFDSLHRSRLINDQLAMSFVYECNTNSTWDTTMCEELT